jgi:hypothetical protein
MSENDQYVVLAEYSGKEFECWYYFIKYNGNEKALQHLNKQLEQVEFYILDDLSTFDLDLEHKMSETTVKEMIKLEINSKMFHRMFTGKLEHIDLGLKKHDSNSKKLLRCFRKLGIGRIEDDGEFIHPEDIASSNEEEDSTSGSDYEYHIDSDEESEEESKSSK